MTPLHEFRARAPGRRVLVNLAGVGLLALLWANAFFQVVSEGMPTRLARVTVLTVACLFLLQLSRRRGRERRDLDRDRDRLAVLIDNIPLATLAINKEGRIVTWNRASEQLFGWSRDEVLGLENPTVPPDQKSTSDALFDRIQGGERLHGVEAARQSRDGERIEVALYSAPLGTNGSLVLYDDIRERKRAEQERDHAQRRYQDMIESLPLATYIDRVDDSATNVYMSPQIAEMLGWPPETWSTDHHHFASILHPDDHKRVLREMRQANLRHEALDIEYRLRHRNGDYVWVRDRSTIVRDEHGAEFARGFLLDITEQKRLEEQVLQSQKMDAIGQFVGGIAHDFNNLLTGIGGYADLAAISSDEAAIERSLAGIRTAANDAAALTARLMAFSRRSIPERRLVDLNEITRDAVSSLDGAAPAGIRVELDLAPDLPPVAADLAQLEQVVQNLSLNARDAMPDGGLLTIQTRAVAGEIVLRVRDTGVGMSTTTRLRAPEPFFTTKPEGKGAGLGLSVVYGVVDALGGALSIASETDAGTTVEIRLPAAEAAAPQLPATKPEAPAARGVERILVVEDRDVVRELAREVLVAAGFDAVAVAGGREALAAAAVDSFDLLLTDVVMPEMSGPELALELRALNPALPVLYMSGYTDDVLSTDELRREATAFLRKPFGTTELVGAVRLLLDAQPCASAAFDSASSSPSRVAG